MYNGKYCAIWYDLSATALPSVLKVSHSMQNLICSSSKRRRQLWECLGTCIFHTHTAHACVCTCRRLPSGSVSQPKSMDVLLGSSQSRIPHRAAYVLSVNSKCRQNQPSGAMQASRGAEMLLRIQPRNQDASSCSA